MANLYKKVKGELIKISRAEIKATIMKANKWTTDEYNKQYDIFRNQLRAYEGYQEARGKDVTKQSPVEILYKEAKSKLSHKGGYKPSLQLQQIKGFTSISSGKALTKAKESQKWISKQDISEAKRITSQFGGLINKNAGAREIYEKYKNNPVELEKRLTDYANALHHTMNTKVDADGTFNTGEYFGSTDIVDDDMFAEYFAWQ